MFGRILLIILLASHVEARADLDIRFTETAPNTFDLALTGSLSYEPIITSVSGPAANGLVTFDTGAIQMRNSGTLSGPASNNTFALTSAGFPATKNDNASNVFDVPITTANTGFSLSLSTQFSSSYVEFFGAGPSSGTRVFNETGSLTLTPGNLVPSVNTWENASNGDVIILTITLLVNNPVFQSELNANQVAIFNSLFNPSGAISSDFQAVIDSLKGASVFGVASGQQAFNALSPLAPHEAMSNLAFGSTEAFITGMRNRALLSYLEQYWGGDFFDISGLGLVDPSLDPSVRRMFSPMFASLASHRMYGTRLVSDVAMHSAYSGVDITDPKAMLTAPQKDWQAWIGGNFYLADDEGNDDREDFDYHAGGLSIGADYRLSTQSVIGLFWQYSTADVDLDRDGSKLESDSHTVGFSWSWWEATKPRQDGWHANAQAAYTYHDYSTTRELAFAGRTAEGETEGHQLTVAGQTGYDFRYGYWTMGPTFGVQYTRLDVDGYTESNAGAASLTVADDEVHSLQTSLGVRIGYNWNPNELVIIRPTAHVSWVHEYLDDSRGITASFNDPAVAAFTVDTADRERDWANAGMGIQANFGDWHAEANWSFQLGRDNFEAHSLGVSLRHDF